MENRKKLTRKTIIKLFIAIMVFYIGLFSFPKKVDITINYLTSQKDTQKDTQNNIQDNNQENTKESEKKEKEEKNITHPNTSLEQMINNFSTLSLLEETSSFPTEDEKKQKTKGKKEQSEIQHNSAKLELLDTINKQKITFKTKFDNECKEKELYCNLINFNNSNDYINQFMRLRLTEAIGTFISEKQLFGKPIFSVLKKIDILNKKGSPRAYASWSKITLHGKSINSHTEYFNLIGHEIGHIIDLGSIHGNAKKKHALFTEFGKEKFSIDDPSLQYYALSWIDEQTRKSGMSQPHFCSRYGMSNPFEDFAECHNLYLNHNNMFLLMAKSNPTMKEKYNFMANLYGGKYIFNDEKNIIQLQQYDKWRVWDTTKLSE